MLFFCHLPFDSDLWAPWSHINHGSEPPLTLSTQGLFVLQECSAQAFEN